MVRAWLLVRHCSVDPRWLTVRVLETTLSLPWPLPGPGEHPRPPRLLLCADGAAGVVNSHTRRSANPPAAPPSVSDVAPALAGFAEHQIEMNSTPPERRERQGNDCDPQIGGSAATRSVTIPLLPESACGRVERLVSVHRLCPWLWF